MRQFHEMLASLMYWMSREEAIKREAIQKARLDDLERQVELLREDNKRRFWIPR